MFQTCSPPPRARGLTLQRTRTVVGIVRIHRAPFGVPQPCVLGLHCPIKLGPEAGLSWRELSVKLLKLSRLGYNTRTNDMHKVQYSSLRMTDTALLGTILASKTIGSRLPNKTVKFTAQRFGNRHPLLDIATT